MTKKKDTCPACEGTRVGSVTKTYHPVTGQVTSRTKNPCRRCA